MATVRSYIDGAFGNDETEEVGIGGFTLFARVRERFTRTTDVPTTYLEDGSHVNDHIIHNPLVLSIEGDVSDLHVRPSPAVAALQGTLAQIGNITQYAQDRTQAQVSKVAALVNDFSNAVDRVDAVIDSAGRVATYVGLTDRSAVSNIERFIDTMESIYSSGSLIAIDMPYRTFERMCITSLEVVRDNERNALSFTLEAQQFRFTKTAFVDIGPAPAPSAGTNGQTDGETDKGAQEGQDAPRSFLNFASETVRGWLE